MSETRHTTAGCSSAEMTKFTLRPVGRRGAGVASRHSTLPVQSCRSARFGSSARRCGDGVRRRGVCGKSRDATTVTVLLVMLATVRNRRSEAALDRLHAPADGYDVSSGQEKIRD
jgi:hypothetical protein